MEIPIGNKEILPLLVAGNCDPNRGSSLCGPRLKTTSLLLPSDLPSAHQSRPNVIGGSYYYPGEDFCAWRAQFKALCGRQQWPDSVAKPLAFAYMGDSANEAVMDIPYDGPESLTQLLDAYRTRFQLFDNLRILRLRGESCPRALAAETHPGRDEGASSNHGRRMVSWHQLHDCLPVRIETPGGLLEEIALPPNVEDIRRRTLIERTRHLLSKAEKAPRCGNFSRLNRFNLENYSLPIFQNVLYPNSWITVLVNRIVVPQVCPILLFMACSFVVQSGIVTPCLDGLEVSFTTPRKTASLTGRCFRLTVRSRHFSH